ncbi:MAG: KamA family radical SAM protein [Deltaproteobacteria bacterium]|nr:KamA family radical SAM protein [Deltaproteobacteria bacterium]
MTRFALGLHRDDGWREQLRHAVRSVDELEQHLELTLEELAGARRAEAAGLPLQITPHYLALCDARDPSCPIRRQVVPRIEEEQEAPGDMVDPLGEVAHEVVPGLVQRYPDRALVVSTDHCAIYCRFCTRSRVVGGGDGPLRPAALDAALAAIAERPSIRDVILSGGDPLTLSTERLVALVARVRAIPHVEVIRLATRVPVCLPQRIDRELVDALRPHHPIWVMTHFNHPKELTPESARACATLVDAGFPVMNQSVLLAGVNDAAATLEALFRGLVRWRVRPYYLLMMDPARGTSHLRTPLQRGLDLMQQLQGRVSGLALPKLIVDTPGGMGKVPVGPDYVVARAPGRTTFRTHRGVEVDYLDPPGSSD